MRLLLMKDLRAQPRVNPGDIHVRGVLDCPRNCLHPQRLRLRTSGALLRGLRTAAILEAGDGNSDEALRWVPQREPLGALRACKFPTIYPGIYSPIYRHGGGKFRLN